ncbi:HNH endonuclease [Salegentibacter sp. BDJ18]|uniref:HNH endonuclease n=1 Tax=Salegentibacter sp. BDJ18 TaxID=2816376 RepID=UPI001AAEC4A8|nr:HNH endonuclease [Salegentibacter sp. BDJ18]MBO2546150.1 HNH endonuclease [Salegentibacter sp. BDJ18]
METNKELRKKESFECSYCGEKAKVVDIYQDYFAILIRCESCKTFIEKLSDCEHNFGTYKFKYSEGMIQVITRCIKCGKFKKAHKKKDFNLESLEFYDNSLENEYYQNLNKARRQFYKKQDSIRLAEKKLTNAWTIQNWYQGYLESNMWKRKRAWVFNRSKGHCERCGEPAAQVHHKTYERLGYEAPEDLMAVCMSCHGKEHSENPGLDVVSHFKLNEIT